MALEITTVGARVYYAWSAANSSTKPSTGWTELPNVNTAPEFDLAPETIDASDITDKKTRYVPGRQDPGGDASYTLNHTNNIVDVWNTLATTAETNYADGKQLWWAYVYPGADDSFFWIGQPLAMGTSGINQNVLSTIPAHCAVNDVIGWDTKPTIASA